MHLIPLRPVSSKCHINIIKSATQKWRFATQIWRFATQIWHPHTRIWHLPLASIWQVSHWSIPGHRVGLPIQPPTAQRWYLIHVNLFTLCSLQCKNCCSFSSSCGGFSRCTLRCCCWLFFSWLADCWGICCRGGIWTTGLGSCCCLCFSVQLSMCAGYRSYWQCGQVTYRFPFTYLIVCTIIHRIEI